jgi:hypothetical protein
MPRCLGPRRRATRCVLGERVCGAAGEAEPQPPGLAAHGTLEDTKSAPARPPREPATPACVLVLAGKPLEQCWRLGDAARSRLPPAAPRRRHLAGPRPAAAPGVRVARPLNPCGPLCPPWSAPLGCPPAGGEAYCAKVQTARWIWTPGSTALSPETSGLAPLCLPDGPHVLTPTAAKCPPNDSPDGAARRGRGADAAPVQARGAHALPARRAAQRAAGLHGRALRVRALAAGQPQRLAGGRQRRPAVAAERQRGATRS